jgi:hypothetical protein
MKPIRSAVLQTTSQKLLSGLTTTHRIPERPLYLMGLGYLHQSQDARASLEVLLDRIAPS